MQIESLIDKLSKETLRRAITSEDKNALTKLLCSTFDYLSSHGVKIDNFYYASYVACSTKEFDMFSFAGLNNLFKFFGYETQEVSLLSEKEKAKQEIDQGYYFVKKDDFVFRMNYIEEMHNSLYSDFVDAKTAVIIDQEKLQLAEAVIELAEHIPTEVYQSNPVAIDSWVRKAKEVLHKTA